VAAPPSAFGGRRPPLPCLPAPAIGRTGSPLTPALPARHSRFPFDFDRAFGSWVEPAWCDATRTKEGKVSIRRAKLYGKHLDRLAAEGVSGPKAQAAALARLEAEEKNS